MCTQRSAGPLLAAANPCGAVACPATASSPRRGDPGAAAAVQKDPVNSVPSNKMAVIVDHGPHGKYGLSPNRMVPFTPAGDGHTLRRPGADTTGGRDPQSCALGRREWIPPQSELIRAVMLEDSPYLPCGPWSLCSQTHRCVRAAHQGPTNATAGGVRGQLCRLQAAVYSGMKMPACQRAAMALVFEEP